MATKRSDKDPRLVALGNRLEQLRDAKGWSRTDASHASLVPSDTLGRWERGEADPGMISLSRYLDALGADAHYILTGEQRDADDSEPDPAFVVFMQRQEEYGVPLSDDEAESLRSLRAPRGKVLTPELLQAVLHMVRGLDSAKPVRPRPSKAKARPKSSPRRSRKTG